MDKLVKKLMSNPDCSICGFHFIIDTNYSPEVIWDLIDINGTIIDTIDCYQ
jgi:DNA integrity scanning protein DisA with diadenylate cyclase activity